MKLRELLVAACALLAQAVDTGARADEPPSLSGAMAEIVRSDARGSISGLTWKAETVPVSGDQVKLEGTYNRTGWRLFLKRTPIQLSSEGQFKLVAPAKERVLAFDLMAVGPEGEVETEKVGLIVTTVRREPLAGSSFTTFAGLASTLHRETRKQDLKMTATAVKASYRTYVVPQKWYLEGGGYLTAFPLSSNRPDLDVRYLGLNLRVGRILGWIGGRWSLSVALGASYATMFVTNDALGYSHLIEPQLYPALTYLFKNEASASVYLKYVPLSASFVPSFSEREIAFGAAWTSRTQGGHAVIISLDFSDLLFNPKAEYTIHTQTYGISVGYTF